MKILALYTIVMGLFRSSSNEASTLTIRKLPFSDGFIVSNDMPL
jgi:hypothetical protein